MNKTYIMVPVKPVKHDLVSEIDKFIHVPLATYDTYGSVKIGSGLLINNGVLSFNEELIPTELGQLNQDTEHRLVTDAQIEYWDGKVNVSDLNKYYTKSESDSLLNEKTDKTTTNDLIKRVDKNETNIDFLTQNKADKSDIIDNLTTNNSNQMLSARQGYRLNNMINDINALLKSDNVNLDTIQEIVNYIENNKDLIDSIMLTKVNISDVIDNLTTTDSTKPLSANQGVILKEFIDALPEWAKQPTKPTYYYSEILERPTQVRVSVTKVGIPTKVSQLENDGDGISKFVTEQNVDLLVSNINNNINDVADSIPLKTSQLINDGNGISNFATEQFVTESIENIDYSGIEQKIETVKNSIPTRVSQLTNDGYENSPFATERFVEQNGGKIDSISINGKEQIIDANKNVDIKLPENISVTDKNNNFTTSQTINGTLTINGNIVQNGTAYETHAEQVYTTNDVITLREGAVGGLDNGKYAGFEAEKYDGENTGVLGFGADGIARVGDKGNTQPLLTRQESSDLTNGSVFVWNSETNRAESSSDYVKFTDIADTSKAGVVTLNRAGQYGIGWNEKTGLFLASATNNEISLKNHANKAISPINLDYATKIGLTTNTLEWSDEEKASARNLIGAISAEDSPVWVAGGATAGRIKTSQTYGIKVITNGLIAPQMASNAQIDGKTQQYTPIVPANLDYAVKKALAYEALSGTEQAWTEEEKQSARNLLGAISKDSITLIKKDNGAYKLTIVRE